MGYIKSNKLQFKTSICIKTLYNYSDRGLFLRIRNKKFVAQKEEKKKSTYSKKCNESVRESL